MQLFIIRKNIRGKIEVKKEQERISISIADNGVGIEEKELENLFNCYYRGVNTG